jgi:ubiquinone/menaquinone biosynthesis C-methylase UbiE
MERAYVPALGYRFLTRFYDPLVRATLKDRKLKSLLVDVLGVGPAMRVVDIGCGPGTLAVNIALAHPDAEVTGLDGDPEILGIARSKAERAGARVRFVVGSATAPPLEHGTFDRVATSLMLHHLSPEQKRDALRAMFDLLRPGGRLVVSDWGRPSGAFMRAAFVSIQILDGFPNTADHVRGRLPEYIRNAGFADVAEIHRERTIYGTLRIYTAAKP